MVTVERQLNEMFASQAKAKNITLLFQRQYEEKYVSVRHGRSCPVAIKHPNCFSVFDAIIKVDTEG